MSKRLEPPAQDWPIVPPEMISQCSGCGRRYKVDVQIPDQIWSRIWPRPGKLCGSCIVMSIEALDEFASYDLAPSP